MPYHNQSLDKLLRPKSIAIIGASNRAEAFSFNLLKSLRSHGYQGQLFPVNPRYDSIEGVRCYPSLSSLPSVPDCVLYAVADKNLIAAVEESAACGAAGGVIFGRAQGSDGSGRNIQAAITSIGRDAGMSICGANCMGYLNLVDGLQVAGMPFAGLVAKSGISLVSHSGSTWAGLVGNRRGIGFDFAISAGQELVTNLGHYIDFLLDQHTTRAIACVVETVRDPDRFLSAVNRADRMGVPVIALKLGRSEKGKRFAVSHSGAISGSTAVYEAIFDAQNVIQVRTLDELLDTVELFAAHRRPTGTGIGIGTDSGGERQLIVDVASDVGIDLPELSPASAVKIQQLLDPGMEAANPLDYWGDGKDVMAPCLSLLSEDPAVGTIVMASNMPPGRPFVAQCADAIIEVSQRTEKPVALMGNIATTMACDGVSRVRAAGIPVLMGTDTGLRALRHFTRYRPGSAKPLTSPGDRDDAKVSRWKRSLSQARHHTLNSADGFDLLTAFGISAAPFARIANWDDLERFLEGREFPIVLKIDDPDILHKSEVGGVILGISSKEQAFESYEALEARHPGVPKLAQMQLSGHELILGMTTDEDFGPMVTIGLGGIYAEIFKDAAVLPPPIGHDAAERALRSLRCFPILAGARGKTPVNIEQLIDAIISFGHMSLSVKGIISEIEINPLLVGRDGIVAVDCIATYAMGDSDEHA